MKHFDLLATCIGVLVIGHCVLLHLFTLSRTGHPFMMAVELGFTVYALFGLSEFFRENARARQG